MLITDVAKRLLNSTDPTNVARTLAQLFDLKGLSKELATNLTERAVKQKDLLIEALAREFSNFLSKINITEEAQKILEGMSLNIQASLDFKDKKTGSKVSVHQKRASPKKALRGKKSHKK